MAGVVPVAMKDRTGSPGRKPGKGWPPPPVAAMLRPIFGKEAIMGFTRGGAGPMLAGVLWMICCLFSFIAMTVATRQLSADLPVFQILTLRSAVGLLLILSLSRRIWPELRRMEKIPLNLLRNSIHFTGQVCWTFGVVLLPLAEVYALEFTMPVWMAVFAFLILGERITRPRLLAIGLSFLGVLVILRPGSGVFDPASFFVLGAAAAFGLQVVLVKMLTRHCSPAIIVVWMVVMQLPMGLVLALPDWRPVGLPHLPWIVIAGIMGLSAHYTMARALKLLDASVAMPIDFFRVPLIAVVGFYLYGETISIWLVIGAGLILFANYYAIRAEGRRARIQAAMPGPG